jgi:hypothetical protein
MLQVRIDGEGDVVTARPCQQACGEIGSVIAPRTERLLDI